MKMFFLVLVYVINFDLVEISAAVHSKIMLLPKQSRCPTDGRGLFMQLMKPFAWMCPLILKVN